MGETTARTEATALIDIWREVGATRFFLEIPPWLVRRQYLFYTIRPPDVMRAEPCRVPFRLDLAREQDLPDLVATRPRFYTLPQLQERLRQKHLAFVGRSGRAVIHIRWIFVGSIHLPYLYSRVILAPHEGYLDEAYTVPAWRRHGVMAAAAAEMLRAVRGRAFERVVCAIAAWNRTPQRVAEAYGYRRVGSFGYWNILGQKRFFCDGAVQDSRNGDPRIGDLRIGPALLNNAMR